MNFTFCFKKVDLLEVQMVHIDLCVAILLTNATPLIFYYKFSFCKLSCKCFLSFSYIVQFYVVGSIFLTMHFIHFDFSE